MLRKDFSIVRVLDAQNDYLYSISPTIGRVVSDGRARGANLLSSNNTHRKVEVPLIMLSRGSDLVLDAGVAGAWNKYTKSDPHRRVAELQIGPTDMLPIAGNLESRHGCYLENVAEFLKG
ncbi:hypothetical protein A1348_16435 [Pseudomonas protegens]|nr:hypothetical protein A1348_16435 [Pseudomonas protegens]